MNLAHEAPTDPGRRVREGSPELTQRVVRPVMPQPEVRSMGPMPEHAGVGGRSETVVRSELQSHQDPIIHTVFGSFPESKLESIYAEEGITIVRGGTLSERNRKKNLERHESGISYTPLRVDEYIVDNADGTRTIYFARYSKEPHNKLQAVAYTVKEMILPKEKGVYKETLSAPDPEGRRKKIGEIERVGEIMESVGNEIGPDGEPRKIMGIFSKEATDEMEREQINATFPPVEAIKMQLARQGVDIGDYQGSLSEKESGQVEMMGKSIKGTLNLAKEKTWEKALYGTELTALSLGTSAFFWLFPDMLIPGGQATRLGINFVLALGGNMLINKVNKGPQMQVKGMLPILGFAALEIVPSVVLSAVFGISVAPTLPLLAAAGIALLGFRGWRKVKDLIDVRNMKKEHPEVKDKGQLKKLVYIERMEKRQEKAANAYKQKHQIEFNKIKQLNPHIDEVTLIDIMQKVDKVALQRKMYESGALYNIKAQLVTLLPMAITFVGYPLMYVIGAITHIPVQFLLPPVAGLSAGGGFLFRQKILTDLKAEVREKNPELLANGNGQNGKK